MQMNVTLAAAVESCTLARCLDSHRFDTCPLVLDSACFAFADCFLKVAKDYGVPVLLNSSGELACCVQVQMSTFTAEQATVLRQSLDKMVTRSAVAETERQMFPLAFSGVKEAVETKQRGKTEADQKEVKELYGGSDWQCPYRDMLGGWMNVTKSKLARSTIEKPDCINLWMCSANRLGLVAHVINRKPGLMKFMSTKEKRMELPLMVFEFLSVVDPIAYGGDFETTLIFQSRDYGNGGFYSGLPYRPTANHRFAQVCEEKKKHTPQEIALTPMGGTTALFVLFAHIARLRHVDITHMDGFMHSCMSYTMSVVHCIQNAAISKARPSVMPVLTGSEVKLGWKLVRQCNKLADDDVRRIVPLALDSFSGKNPVMPDDVVNATKRGFCRQFIDPEDGPKGTPTWRDTRYSFMTVPDAEKCMAHHAHYDGILRLREWVKRNKEMTADCEKEHKESIQKLAYDNKTTLASLLQKKGAKSPSRLICIELKNVNAANCVPCIELVLCHGVEFFAVEYFSREDSHYNTLIVTRAADWAAFQTYSCFEVFSESMTARNAEEGLDVSRMPQASSVFQLISSGSPSQLRVAFWILGTWYDLQMREYPRLLDPTNHRRIAACLKKAPLLPEVVHILVAGDLSGKFHRERFELMNAIMEDPNDPRIEMSLRALGKSLVMPYSSPNMDKGRYAWQSMQMQFTRARSKAHSFNTSFEPGCNNDNGVGVSLMTALDKAERFYCGCDTSGEFTPMDATLCGVESHACTSLYDFPLAIQRGKSKTSILYVDTCVFIRRREYDEELEKSDMFRWFEKLYLDSLPPSMFEGGNAIRKVQLQSVLKDTTNVKKRPAATVKRVSSPKRVRVYEPEMQYSPTRE